MKKLITIFTLTLLALNSFGQDLKVTESSNAFEAQQIKADGTTAVLEQQTPNTSFSESIKGTEHKLRVKLPSSTVIVAAGKAQFLINLSHNHDLSASVKLVKLKPGKKNRTTRTFIAGPFNKAGDETPELLDFSAEKYGENSYIITLNNIEAGEYAFIIGGADFVANKGVYGKSLNFQLFSVK